MPLSIELEEFSDLMAFFEPFEPAPHIAVGVSGGPDSLCLTLLLREWVQSKGGKLTALTVDHGLRPDSAAEARKVKKWLGNFGIAHEVIQWLGEKPQTRVQETAREARLRLLELWCEAHQVLHLCLAHHADDQAETIVMRLAHKSGAQGLRGIQAERLRPLVRVLRPLLAVPAHRLKATLRGQNQEYLTDPTNHNLSYERARWRQLMGMMPRSFTQDCLQLGSAITRILSRELEGLFLALTPHILIYPSGYAWVDATWFDDLSPRCKVEMFRRILTTIGGRLYPPAEAPTENLIMRLLSPMIATLHGCIIVRRQDIWIGREQRSCSPAQTLAAGTKEEWDGRFIVSNGSAQEIIIAPLGRKRLPQYRSFFPKAPAQVLWSVPAAFVRDCGQDESTQDEGADGKMIGIETLSPLLIPLVTFEFSPPHPLFI